ncbi:xanthine dehydrogenase accessory protein XdhC [Rhizobium sp. KVB221]|uniref:Xanthine dehydrogenase accessory protein XdhC n=1 Tax=Rhizobium setariae TaxID=2801340 RepID=A0A936YPY9_9HYPH|nr:xanthine dehydrogenase accessory protein XdhC [Rhizobium setariae]MBL0372079.1 xanthine dehydrogenase accessory protein XdhC [Rhizobium setariae]
MTLDEFLANPGEKVVIEVTRTRGSTPRETGAFMLVSADHIWGTIGGGHMEFEAIDLARDMVTSGRNEATLDVTLGPETGQCCGGRVELALKRAGPQAIDALKARLAREAGDYPDVFIFGAGHVGRALAIALKPLPFKVTVIETRRDELDLLLADVPRRLEAMPESAVGDIRAGGAVVIATHDHALDFLIGAEALKRSDLTYVGMIGSKTKRGVFASWLEDAELDRKMTESLILPIGGTAVKDKRPEVIAALVAAELLTVLL